MRFDRPIAFIPNLARELGGIEEALYYQQLHYWGDKGDREDGFIYKTVEQLEEETTLTRRQQDRVRAKLVKMGWLEVKNTHAPNGAPTLHYKTLVEISLEMRKESKIMKTQMFGVIPVTDTPGDIARKFFTGDTETCAPIAAALEKAGFSAPQVASEMLKFKNYWTEPTKSGKKTRWELQVTFDVKRRLKTWFTNIVNRGGARRAGSGITI